MHRYFIKMLVVTMEQRKSHGQAQSQRGRALPKAMAWRTCEELGLFRPAISIIGVFTQMCEHRTPHL